jgi:hypothetical protein
MRRRDPFFTLSSRQPRLYYREIADDTARAGAGNGSGLGSGIKVLEMEMEMAVKTDRTRLRRALRREYEVRISALGDSSLLLPLIL